MPRIIKTLAQMNSDSLNYLADNTDITYLSEGSIARAMVEATNIEVSRLGEYVASTYTNVFINTAESFYLDQIGAGIGLRRDVSSKPATSQEDSNIKFSVASGKLGQYFPDSSNLNNGLIPAGLSISTADGSIVYKTSKAISFPYNATEVFVAAIADGEGTDYRVGRNKLVIHTGNSAVNVTNTKAISSGSNTEPDASYRFRLSNHLATTATANEAAVRITAMSNPDVSRVVLKEFARGAGTFDALLVPTNNQLSSATKNYTTRAIELISAFGISSRVIEPTYVSFSMSIQLIPQAGTASGSLDAAKLSAKNSVLNYIDTIPMGGELIINRIRAAALSAVTGSVKDIRVIEICFDNRPHSIRNRKLASDELFTPSTEQEAIKVI